MQELNFPVSVVESKNVLNGETLLKRKKVQIGFHEETAVTDGGGYIVLDYGTEMRGGIRILTAEVLPDHCANVRIRFGESLTEVYSSVGEKGATNHHAPRDFEYPLVSRSDLRIGDSGYRFVRIDFPAGKKIELKSIIGTNTILRRKPIYTYEGKDERVAKIFQTAKRTIDLCAAGDYIWDGIKRDRLVWIGDMHPEMLALTTLYGRFPAVERSLDFVREETPLPEWMNRYPMYSLWWIIIVCDYFRLTGNKTFTEKQLPYLCDLLKVCADCIRQDGELNFPRYFVDWPTRGTNDELVGARAIAIIAVKKAVELLRDFSLDTSLAEELLLRLKKVPLNVEKQKQVIALKYFAEGELSDADYQRLIEGGGRGLSTFMGYYILTAIASRDKDKAIEIMKEYYGGMLDKGATTFWEDFNLDWCENSGRIDAFPQNGQRDVHGDFGAYCYSGFRHSLCHGWASGVIRFIYENC
ncbi:MAG: alpha-L-rhamnosidase [Candidatus Gallimonas sp.]